MSRSLKPSLPAVLAYHAEIHVQRGDQILTLEVDRPDWAPEKEVLRGLAKERGLETVGDVVAALEGEGKVRIEPVGAGGFYCQGDRDIHEMGERLA